MTDESREQHRCEHCRENRDAMNATDSFVFMAMVAIVSFGVLFLVKMIESC